MAHEWLMAVTSDGERVAETEIAEPPVEIAIREGRASGAQLLWVHTNLDLAPFGFERTPGYTRLRADTPGAGDELPLLALGDYARTLAAAYRGLWGHKYVPADASPPDDGVVVGLYSEGEPIGLCRVFVSERLVDAPGVIPGARARQGYLRLLSGACALLGPGPIDLDSWGDAEETLESYAALGFAPVEHIDGWELRLGERG